ncbi:hypothetical protein [Pilimelia terevasa]|nr:hypothetical protein [Pilimelia terevasa]
MIKHETVRLGQWAAARLATHGARAVAMGTVGLVASASVLWSSAQSAFNATTTNPNNSMSMGSVAISDNDSNVALFTASNLLPGNTATSCIVVTYSGSATGTVKLYTSSYNATDGAADGAVLGTWLKMLIQVGTGTCGAPVGLTDITAATPGDTMATVSGKTTFANGYGTGWTSAASGNTRVFRFTYTVDASTPQTAMGDGITTNFVWEAQNN